MYIIINIFELSLRDISSCIGNIVKDSLIFSEIFNNLFTQYFKQILLCVTLFKRGFIGKSQLLICNFGGSKELFRLFYSQVPRKDVSVLEVFRQDLEIIVYWSRVTVKIIIRKYIVGRVWRLQKRINRPITRDWAVVVPRSTISDSGYKHGTYKGCRLRICCWYIFKLGI